MKDNNNILILDDYERRAIKFLSSHPGAHWVKTADQCIKALNDYIWHEVYLDHDLEDSIYSASGRRGDGMEVVDWLTKYGPKHLDNTVFTIHSMNNIHGTEMVARLRLAGYKAFYRPYHGDFWAIDKERDNPIDNENDPCIFYMPGKVVLDVSPIGITEEEELPFYMELIASFLRKRKEEKEALDKKELQKKADELKAKYLKNYKPAASKTESKEIVITKV